jgi:hypothetical protein
LVGTAARTAVVAGTATAVVGGVSNAQQAKAAQQAQADAYQQQEQDKAMKQAAEQAVAAAQPSSPKPVADDGISQLERLAMLQQQGILTAEEFAAEKARILAT